MGITQQSVVAVVDLSSDKKMCKKIRRVKKSKI